MVPSDSHQCSLTGWCIQHIKSTLEKGLVDEVMKFADDTNLLMVVRLK